MPILAIALLLVILFPIRALAFVVLFIIVGKVAVLFIDTPSLTNKSSSGGR